MVAPRVGAWIETLIFTQYDIRGTVAPRVGAWIETLFLHRFPEQGCRVAPRVGAWIETTPRHAVMHDPAESHPVWVRGLKLKNCYCNLFLLRRTPCGCVD